MSTTHSTARSGASPAHAAGGDTSAAQQAAFREGGEWVKEEGGCGWLALGAEGVGGVGVDDGDRRQCTYAPRSPVCVTDSSEKKPRELPSVARDATPPKSVLLCRAGFPRARFGPGSAPGRRWGANIGTQRRVDEAISSCAGKHGAPKPPPPPLTSSRPPPATYFAGPRATRVLIPRTPCAPSAKL
jgi:hypothetical protein